MGSRTRAAWHAVAEGSPRTVLPPHPRSSSPASRNPFLQFLGKLLPRGWGCVGTRGLPQLWSGAERRGGGVLSREALFHIAHGGEGEY